MRKLCFFIALAVVAGMSINAQNDSNREGFHIEASIGLPVGDFDDITSFAFAVGVNNIWSVSDEFDFGVAATYSNFMGKSIDIPIIGSIDMEDTSTLILNVLGRFYLSDGFSLGAGVGYGVGLSPDGYDGGFYYAPEMRYWVGDGMNIFASYGNISNDGITMSSINLGVEFGL